MIEAALGSADRFAIVPEQPYTDADLDYNTDCRANREQNDPNARPAMLGEPEYLEPYDIIFLGHPVWWGRLPRILYTFLESCDLSGKIVIPFCTSGSSGNTRCMEEIRTLQPDAIVTEGRRFSIGASEEEVHEWVNEKMTELQQMKETVYVRCGDSVLSFALADNPSAESLPNG